MKTSKILVFLASLILLAAIIHLLYHQLWSTPTFITFVFNRNLYLVQQHHEETSLDHRHAPVLTEHHLISARNNHHGSSSVPLKRVLPFPFYKVGVPKCPLPTSGVPGTYEVSTEGLRYGRLWPVTKCNSRTFATDKICEVLASQIHECDRQSLMQIIDIFRQFAIKNHWLYFMGAVMLLGSWRHHGLVPYRRDLTIYVNISHKEELISKFSRVKITDETFLDDHTLRISPISSSRSETYVDILFYQANSTHILHTSSNGAGSVIEKRLVFPTHFRPFEVFDDLQAPRSSAVILYKLFGDSSVCGIKNTNVPCSKLKDFIPFVIRRVAEYFGPIEERLALGNLTYQFEFPKEDVDSVSDNPYTLQLK